MTLDKNCPICTSRLTEVSRTTDDVVIYFDCSKCTGSFNYYPKTDMLVGK